MSTVDLRPLPTFLIYLFISLLKTAQSISISMTEKAHIHYNCNLSMYRVVSSPIALWTGIEMTRQTAGTDNCAAVVVVVITTVTGWHKVSNGGGRWKDAARPLVCISALSSIQCFDAGGLVALIRRGSLSNQMEEETRGELSDPGLPGITAMKRK